MASNGKAKYDYDVLAIGAGTASLSAIKALMQGGKNLRLAMVEREEEKVGGDCLFTGCVPTKTLLATARLFHDIQHKAAGRGIRVEAANLDFAATMRHAHATIQKIGEVSDAPDWYRERGVDLLWGEAAFVDQHTIRVGGREITAGKFVIGTGSRPIMPHIPGLPDDAVLNNETVLELTELPDSMLIIGGGPIGVEFGQMFARFGSQVAILDRGSQLLEKEDHELANLMRGYLEAEGIRIVLGAEIVAGEQAGGQKQLTIRHSDGGEERVTVAAVLSAIGRTADLSPLKLDNAGVEAAKDDEGKIQGIAVNERLQTSVAHIYAGGDCVGPYYFTHVAEQEGRFIAGNMYGGRKRRNYAALPWVTFTDPELAHLGLTEAQARAQHGSNVEVTYMKFDEVDRARTEGEELGMIKLITTQGVLGSPLAVRILGAHILGSSAGELIHEFVPAMHNSLNPGIFALAIHAYPTLALGNRQVLGKRFAAHGGVE